MRNIVAVLFCLASFSTSGETPKAAAPAQTAPSAPVIARGAFLAFFVSDVERSIAWYRSTFGLELSERQETPEGVKVAILESGEMIVELIQHKDAAKRPQGYTQGIFKAGVIVDGYDRVVARLQQEKVDIAFGPFPAKGKQRANVIIRDPDGNLIQLFGPK